MVLSCQRTGTIGESERHAARLAAESHHGPVGLPIFGRLDEQGRRAQTGVIARHAYIVSKATALAFDGALGRPRPGLVLFFDENCGLVVRGCL
jgi:hypothetical protein